MDPHYESITSKELLQFSTLILDILKWYPESIQLYYWSLEALLAPAPLPPQSAVPTSGR